MHRVVIALAVLLVGVLGVGVVTALGRSGDDGKPGAAATPSAGVPTSGLPSTEPTGVPTTEPPVPTTAPPVPTTPVPTTGPTGNGGNGSGGNGGNGGGSGGNGFGGNGGSPNMPNTGLSPALAILASGTAAGAIGVRRLAR
jgi:uncharacterized membrane protein YgcG